MLKVIDKDIKKLMMRFGQTVTYYPSRICSCMRENGGVPLLNHTCNQGYYYGTPETVHVVRTGVKEPYLNTNQGVIFNGDCIYTLPKYYTGTEQKAYTTLAKGDIFVQTNKTRRDTDILVRGTRDYVLAFDVEQILSIYSNTTQYVEGTDFEVALSDVDAGKLTTINWLDGGSAPEVDDAYTVEFICKQQYRVWDDGGMDRGTDEEELPKKIKLITRRFINPLKDNTIDNVQYSQTIF